MITHTMEISSATFTVNILFSELEYNKLIVIIPGLLERYKNYIPPL